MSRLLEAIDRRSNAIRRIFLVLGVIIVSFPKPMVKLTFGGDPSWIVGINVAAYKGMVFGRDILFTYGPLGFALNPVDFGPEGWIEIAMLAHLTLYVIWWLSMSLVVSRMEDVRDELLFLIGSFVASYQESGGNIVVLSVAGFLSVGRTWGRLPLAILAGIVAGLGLLVKFNVGVSCTAVIVAWSGVQLLRGPWKAALPIAASALVSALGASWLGYVLSGGNTSEFVSFVKDSVVLSQDYSAQMSWDGPIWQEYAAIVLVLAVTTYAFLGLLLQWKGWDLAFTILPAVFLGYKSGIVRHDSSHFVQGMLGAATLTTLLVLSTAGRTSSLGVRRFAAAMLFLGLTAVAALEWFATITACAVFVGWIGLSTFKKRAGAVEVEPTTAPRPPSRRLTLAFLSGIVAVPLLLLAGLALPRFPESLKLPRGPKQLLAHLHLKSWLTTSMALDGTLERDISPEIVKAVGDAKIDGYPVEISRLIQHGLNWSPRFVIQSYQSYSPTFDLRSAKHYDDEGAPAFVLYEFTSIDFDHPFIVDPATFNELYRWYDYRDQSGDFLLLARRSAPRWREGKLVGKGSIGFDERWVVPDAECGPIILKAQIEPNTFGRLKRTFHKIIPPWIRIEYADGTKVDHRLVWRNAENGFLVSDLPRKTGSVRNMFEGGRGDRVQAVTFLGPAREFEKSIRLEWSQIETGSPTKTASLKAD